MKISLKILIYRKKITRKFAFYGCKKYLSIILVFQLHHKAHKLFEPVQTAKSSQKFDYDPNKDYYKQSKKLKCYSKPYTKHSKSNTKRRFFPLNKL